MMQYESSDDRTGIPVGKIVELTEEELNKIPFNVYMKCLESITNVIGEDVEKIAIMKKAEMKKVELKMKLTETGLSPKRIDKIVDSYADFAMMIADVNNLPIDEIGKNYLKEKLNISTKVIKKKQGVDD